VRQVIQCFPKQTIEEIPVVGFQPKETKATAAIPFTDQIEQATKARDLDVIARAIKAAGITGDELDFLRNMVTEARKRLEVAAT
jgi:hypothetical protein